MTRIDPPLVGHWPYRLALPRVVRLFGVTFRWARLRESRPGIVAQYREHRARDSMHLHVFSDGKWKIDHCDDFNPDFGPWQAVRHFFADHPLGQILTR